jgi:DNA-binding transcriptional LysR family regulator
MDSIAGMRILVRVVESGSFSAAARRLGVAPSSVSRQINELEEDLGARLFARTTRKLSLTEAGQLYFERASSIINDVEEAKLALSQLGAPSGILRVTVPSGIGRELVASAVPAFLDRYPAIKIVLSMTDRMLDLVDAGIDVAIRVGRQQDSSFKARKIGESLRVVCASPEYLKKAGIPKTPADLEQHNCVTWRDHPGHNIWTFRGPEGVTKVRASGNFFAQSADALVAATVAGLGLSLLPDWNMAIELRQQQLCAVLTDYEASPAASPIYAVHAHQRHVPPKIRAFIDFLIEGFAESRYS